jgi:hypothetical protein
MKPILTVVQIRENAETNVYGYEKIHFYAFNIDGSGRALVTHDDEQEFEIYGSVDVEAILCGDPGDGTRWYLPVLN